MQTNLLKVLVFKPFEDGIICSMFLKDCSAILGGCWEDINKNFGFKDVTIISDELAIDKNLPRHRTVSGTFIVLKVINGEYDSLTNEEIVKIKNKLDSFDNFEGNSKYLKTFFQEKNLTSVMFEYQRGIYTFSLSNYDIIEQLVLSNDNLMIKKAESIIRQIDFKNGNVNHFLEHMGNGMADEMLINNEAEVMSRITLNQGIVHMIAFK